MNNLQIVENHMVIDNERSVDELEAIYKEHNDKELVESGAEILLSGGSLKKTSYSYCPTVSMDDVITAAMEDDTINDCIKQIMMIVPSSKLSQLIREKAREVAADALDIILED